MDPLLVQRTRYLLKSRFRRPQTCPTNLLPSACKQLLEWLTAHPLLAANLIRLEEIETNAAVECNDILEIAKKEPITAIERKYDAKSLEGHAAICYRTIGCLASLNEVNSWAFQNASLSIATYLTGSQTYELDKALDAIRDVALDGLFEYLDERLDSDSATYAVLLKYKQRCEWFHRHRVREFAESGLEGKKGERALAIDLYDYILGQGVDFTIEQSSASGEVDLVLSNSDQRKLIIDAKYLNADTNRSEAIRKISEGFHQVARYCNDYSEASGFLVAFIASRKRINLNLEQRDGLEYVGIGGRSVYFLPIYIGDEPSASKSGKAEIFEISLDELVAKIKTEISPE
jgi:hypothetical protein